MSPYVSFWYVHKREDDNNIQTREKEECSICLDVHPKTCWEQVKSKQKQEEEKEPVRQTHATKKVTRRWC